MSAPWNLTGGRPAAALIGLALLAAAAGPAGRAAGSPCTVAWERLSPEAIAIVWRAPPAAAGSVSGWGEPLVVLVPRAAEVTIEAERLAARPCPPPQAVPDRDPAGPPAAILSDGVARHLRLVSLSINPFRPAPGGTWEQADQVRVVVRHGPLPDPGRRPPPALDRLETGLAALAVNGSEALRLWSPPPDPDPGERPSPGPAATGGGRDSPALKIGTSAPGVYWLAGELDPLAEVDPRHLRLKANGRTVRMWVIGEEDGVLDPGDAVLFFGTSYHPDEFEEDRFTDTQVYWLFDAGAPASRFTPLAAGPESGPEYDHGPARVHVEENLEPSFHSDKFMWTLVRAGESLDFTVTAEEATGGPAVLRWSIWGYTSLIEVIPDHHVQIHFNGRLVADATFDDYEQFTGEVELEPGELAPGDNTVRVTCPGDTGAGEIDAVSVDWFEIDYDRRHVAGGGQLACRTPAGAGPGPIRVRAEGFAGPEIEVFDLTAGRRLTGALIAPGPGGYQATIGLDLAQDDARELAFFWRGALRQPDSVVLDVPSNWASEANGADLIVVIHSLFRQAFEPYLEHARSGGRRVAVVDVEDVFDEFAGGVFQPPAISTFVRHAYRYWQAPAPEALLLVGDANWDYKENLGPGIVPNYVPGYAKDNPFAAGAAPGGGRSGDAGAAGGDRDPFRYGDAMIDDQFVCVDGIDSLPDMIVARLPVGSVAETELVTSKMLAQIDALPAGPWRRRMVYVTGGVDDAEQALFGGQSTVLIESLVQPEEKGFAAARIDKETEGYGWDQYEDEIRTEIDSGAALVNFFGHAGSWSWEAMFDFDDIDRLANAGRLPLVTSMTCNTLRFANPDMQSFGERFLLTATPATGASGVWGGCTFGDLWADFFLAYNFLDQALEGGQGEVGAAILLGKVKTLLQQPAYSFILEPYSYLGDPYARFAWGAAGGPSIWLAGSGTGRLAWGAGGRFEVLAFVFDPDGAHDVRRVELTLDGIPTGVRLLDDGLSGDFGAHDGLFGISLEVGPGLVPAGRYRLGLTAADMAGHQAALWPEFAVGP